MGFGLKLGQNLIAHPTNPGRKFQMVAISGTTDGSGVLAVVTDITTVANAVVSLDSVAGQDLQIASISGATVNVILRNSATGAPLGATAFAGRMACIGT